MSDNYRVIGRRFLPCGHQRFRPPTDPDDWYGFIRTCNTCHKQYTGVIKHNDLLTTKLGRPCAAIAWDVDVTDETIKGTRDQELSRTVKKATIGGRKRPPDPPHVPPKRITRVGPPRKDKP